MGERPQASESSAKATAAPSSLHCVPTSPKMLAMLPSSSTSVMKMGTVCRCMFRATQEFLKELLMKVTWITSLAKGQRVPVASHRTVPLP